MQVPTMRSRYYQVKHGRHMMMIDRIEDRVQVSPPLCWKCHALARHMRKPAELRRGNALMRLMLEICRGSYTVADPQIPATLMLVLRQSGRSCTQTPWLLVEGCCLHAATSRVSPKYCRLSSAVLDMLHMLQLTSARCKLHRLDMMSGIMGALRRLHHCC